MGQQMMLHQMVAVVLEKLLGCKKEDK